MPTIGTLTVDLTANTAQFSGDLGKAAQDAENFGEKSAAAGHAMDFSMREARGSMMLLGEEVGVHIPRHLQALIAELPGVGAAFAEMLPLVGVVAAIAIIAKLIEKNEEAKEKLEHAWASFDITVQDVFNRLDEKLLKAGEKADELSGRHLDALKKKLAELDHESLNDLVAAFGHVSKAAEAAFAEMQPHWYTLGEGARGAQHALKQFSDEYESLLTHGKDKEAGDLLAGTLERASGKLSELTRAKAAMGSLGATGTEIEAQRRFVETLEDQVTAAKKIADVTNADKANVNTEELNREAAAQEKLDAARQKSKEYWAANKKAMEADIKTAEEMVAKESEAMAQMNVAVLESVRKQQDEKIKITVKAGEEELRESLAMAKLNETAESQAARYLLKMHEATSKEITEAEVKAAEERRNQEADAYNKEIALLGQFGDKEAAKIKELEDKKKQLYAQSENEITNIRQRAEEERNRKILDAEHRFESDMARGLAGVITGHQSFGNMMRQIGDQVAQGLIENALTSIMANDMTKPSDAAAAARKMYLAGTKFPWPLDIVMPPILAAGAFAAVMAFEQGGEIPGDGAVPIIAHAGETVVTKALTDQVKGNVGKGGKGHTVNVHTTVNAVDAENFGQLLNKHASVVAAHVTGQLRRMNK
jgi:hypothetical protein